jgi:hypothetical protein
MITHFNWPNKISMPVMYANRQWAVTKYGLECLTVDYQIERLRIAERLNDSGISKWVIHLCEKKWCDIREFTDCLEVGLDFHRVKGRSFIDLGESLTFALKKVEKANRFERFVEEVDPLPVGKKFRMYGLGDLVAMDELYEEHQKKQREFNG